jgi:hypothetical protein
MKVAPMFARNRCRETGGENEKLSFNHIACITLRGADSTELCKLLKEQNLKTWK